MICKNSHHLQPLQKQPKQPKRQLPMSKYPSQANVNMAILFEKIPRNKMALRFAKTAWIK